MQYPQQPPYNPYQQPYPAPPYAPQPPMPPKRNRVGMILLIVGTSIVGFFIIALAIGAAVSNDDTAASAPAMTKAAPAKLTAAKAAEQLADATGMTDLGDPQDNTGSCANASGDEAKWNCRQLITTDTVSVYEFGTPAVAEHWVKAMKDVGNDWRQVGRFALAWQARDQHLTSEKRRGELVTALKRIAD